MIVQTEPGTDTTHLILDLSPNEYRVLVNLVDNAWRMADEYREGREPGSESETKALIYQLQIERIQGALKVERA